jgi:hypothetical protein
MRSYASLPAGRSRTRVEKAKKEKKGGKREEEEEEEEEIDP